MHRKFIVKTKEQLCDGVGYCCLGVLAEIFHKKVRKIKSIDGFGSVSYDDQDGELPECVMEWAGIRTSCGEFGRNGKESLALLNDEENKTFEEIADIIEKRPTGLFTQSA